MSGYNTSSSRGADTFHPFQPDASFDYYLPGDNSGKYAYFSVPSNKFKTLILSGKCGAYAYITIRVGSASGTILYQLLNPGTWDYQVNTSVDISKYHDNTIYISNAPQNAGSNFYGTAKLTY